VTNDAKRSEAEWKARLSPDRYAVLRKAATEAPFSGSHLHVDADGIFRCGGCGQVLFRTAQKFDSGCGWPSFDACEDGAVIEREDRSLFRRRTEILCSQFEGHLGHVFDDGPTPTGLRYCVNSLALDFEARAD
jgi:peptide-methionine (R)-S-oxide reductase